MSSQLMSLFPASLRAIIEYLFLRTLPDFSRQRITHFLREMTDKSDRAEDDRYSPVALIGSER